MSKQNLIIYNFISLYQILEELASDLNFKIIFVDNENSLNNKVKNLNNFLIISNKKFSNIANQFVLDNVPINIFGKHGLNKKDIIIDGGIRVNQFIKGNVHLENMTISHKERAGLRCLSAFTIKDIIFSHCEMFGFCMVSLCC